MVVIEHVRPEYGSYYLLNRKDLTRHSVDPPPTHTALCNMLPLLLLAVAADDSCDAQQLSAFFAKVGSSAEAMSAETHLLWNGKHLDDADMKVAKHVLTTVGAPNAIELHLSGNVFGPDGAKELASALMEGRRALPVLENVSGFGFQPGCHSPKH